MELTVSLSTNQWRKVLAYMEMATVENAEVLDRLHTQLGRLVDHPCQVTPNSWGDGGAYVRHHYKVSAFMDGRIVMDGRPGVIVGFDGPHLLVRFDDSGAVRHVHPTWRVDYTVAAWDAFSQAR